MKHDDTIIVGDIHGRVDVVDGILQTYSNCYNIVFVGDYLDSYNQPYYNCCLALQMVLAATKEDNIVGLVGNHELSYIGGSGMGCSGFDPKTDKALDLWGLRDMMFDCLGTHLWIELNTPVLVTHAGISLLNWPAGIDPDRKMVQEFIDSDAMYNIGSARGGPASVGGGFWCDYHEEFAPIPGIHQVFGHTRVRNGCATKDGKNWCVDTLSSHDPHSEAGSEVLLVRLDGTMSTMKL